MKIVYIADLEIRGGATKSLIELTRLMKEKHNVEPIVLTSGNTGLNRALDGYGIENYPVGHGAFMHRRPEKFWKVPIKWMIYYLHYKINFKSSIKKALNCTDWNEVDLIHTNVARDDLGMELSKRTGVKNICHIREFAELDFKCWSYRRDYIQYLSHNTDAFIAISEAVKEYWIKKGLPSEKIAAIYNGVASENIKKADHSTWENDRTLKLVIVGGVIRSKGQWQAAEAIAGLPVQIRKNVTLDIVGKTNKHIKKELKSYFIRAGIPTNIHFRGHRDDVYELLKDYHVGLMCSKSEAFGRVTVEYMLAGLSVIVSDGGANGELVENGVNGLIYDGENTSTLTDAIEKMYLDRKSMISMAVRGKQIAEENYTATTNSQRIYDFYNSVLSPINNAF